MTTSLGQWKRHAAKQIFYQLERYVIPASIVVITPVDGETVAVRSKNERETVSQTTEGWGSGSVTKKSSSAIYPVGVNTACLR